MQRALPRSSALEKPAKEIRSGRVSRVSPVQTAMRNCTRDEGGPFEVGSQVSGLKPPQAAVVKSDGGERCGNAGTGSRQARLREASASEPSMKCRKRIRRCQNRGLTLPPGSARGNPEDCPSGIRHVDGAKLNQALVWNVRTCRSDAKGEIASGSKPRGTRVPMRSTGTEQLVVGMKVSVMGLDRRGCVVQPRPQAN